MMKLFITGASGFIGSHLTNLAKKKGYEIIALNRSFLASQNYDKNIKWLNKDLLDIENIQNYIPIYDLFFNLTVEVLNNSSNIAL